MDESPEPGSDAWPSPVWFAVIAVFVACGLTASAADSPPPALRLEARMFELLNKDRKSHQKKPLLYDARLADVARGHSLDMMKHAFFAHQSPRTGDVGDRLRTMRLRVLAAAENIARSRDVAQAQQQLMRSPGHRKNILSDIFTHVGIGIARNEDGMFFITQVFATPAPAVDLKTLPAEILKAVNRARIARGKLPFRAHRVLARIAAEQARAMADAGKPLALDVSKVARAAGVDHRRITLAHLLTWTPEELARARVLLAPRLGHIGLGFAENTKHKKLGYGILWAVVIFTTD